MINDAKRIISVINHEQNSDVHLKAILQLIGNFEKKWSFRNDIEFDHWLYQIQLAKDNLLTRLNIS